MDESKEDSYNGKEAVQFLQGLGLKIGSSKVYADISKGILPSGTDKRVTHSELLAYAEAVKPPSGGGPSEIERLRKGRTLLRNLVKELFPLLAGSPCDSKLEGWLHEIESLEPEKSFAKTRQAIDNAHAASSGPKKSKLRQQKGSLLLQGIALGIAAKGKIYRKDSIFLARWIRNHKSLWDQPDVRALLDLADAVNINPPESFDEGMSPLYQKVCTFLRVNGLQVPDIKLKGEPWKGNHVSVVLSKMDDMFDHIGHMDFSANFCFTGLFAFGSREQCEQTVRQLGATVRSRPIQSGTNYLIVGTASNPQWRSVHSGSKIDDAMSHRQVGRESYIIHEDDWTTFLLQEQRERGIIPYTPVPDGQFRSPWPITVLYFLVPPPDMERIGAVLQAEGVVIAHDCHRMVDAIIMPPRLCSAGEEELAALPEIGETKAAEVTAARDSGMLVIGEEEFRRWLWRPREEDSILAPTL